MGLLSPWQLAWLGLLAPLIVLYILKRRREERIVGSTLLWEAALRDMRAERPWKRLIPHVSLILQILAIVAGAIALARPSGAGQVPTGARLAVVIDASASMAARDGEGTRIERARSVAQDLARSLPPGGRMMIVEAGREASVLTPPTSDRAALERAVAEISVRGGSADLEAATSLAAERMRGAPSGSRIVVLTDAAEDGRVALDGRSVPVEVRRVGGETANTAIVAADVRARASDDAPDRADVFVRIARFGATPDDVHVTARIEGRGVVASRRVTVPANETTSVVMSADFPPDADGRAAIVRIELAAPRGESRDDALALDDLAVVPSPGGRKLPVFLIGRAPPELQRVLVSDEDVELFATTLEAIARREAGAPALDGFFVYAGATPAEAPAGDSVVVAPAGDRVFGVELGPRARAPRIVSWDEEDPRLRFVSLADVHFAAIRPVRGASARALVTTDAGPAIASIVRPNGETTIVALDPAQSDWPADPSFVIFFRNLLERARARRAAGGIAPGRLGEPLRVPAPDGERVTVETPSGTDISAISRGGVAIVPVPPEPGAYRAGAAGRELHALRNLLDASESDVRPRLEMTRAGRAASGGAVEAEEHSEAWPWFAAALLALLVADAVWATRRTRAAPRRKARAA